MCFGLGKIVFDSEVCLIVIGILFVLCSWLICVICFVVDSLSVKVFFGEVG